MAKPSQAYIEQVIGYTQIENKDLVCQDIYKAVNSTVSCLLLKVAPYYYNNDTSKELPCLYGTIGCIYRGNRYNIPIEIWIKQNHSMIPPSVCVKPTSDMYVSLTSRDVLPNGTVIIPYLKNWCYPLSDLAGLLKAMSDAFSVSPPVYSNPPSSSQSLSNSGAFKPTSKTMSPFSNTFPSAATASLSTNYSLSSNVASNNNNDQQKNTHRFSDISTEPQRMLLPIQGFEQMPVVSLEEAVMSLVSLVPDVQQMVWIAKQNCINPKDGLTCDESASIMIYTMEWEPYEKSFYVALNTCLRAANRQELRAWFLYLRLVIHALQKLPSTSHFVYRGVKSDLTDRYTRGSRIVWWGFSSCTLSIETLKNENFLGKNGTRTLFSIECHSAKNIRSHSYYTQEDEILLLPARQFEVVGCLDQGNGLQLVQLREVQPQFPLIKLPSA